MAKLEKREEKLDTVIGAGANFEGTINVKGGIRIDGRFKGNISVDGLLIIGKEGNVEGEIQAKDAVVGGKLKGKVKVDNKIEFQSGAQFEGELTCRGLVVEEGVKFDGSCSMTKETLFREGRKEKEPKV